ncbi:MAG: ExbD/TolR family protein [Maricaulaceae bacterium]
MAMGMGRNRHGTRGGRRRNRRGGLNAEINVTPLVDVMLVLLIVFMVAAPLLSVGVAVELPKTDAKSLPSDTEPITITINKEGAIFLQETEVSLDDVVARLSAISKNGYEERIYLRGDDASDYGSVMKVMARINAAGYSNLGLVTDPLTK